MQRLSYRVSLALRNVARQFPVALLAMLSIVTSACNQGKPPSAAAPPPPPEVFVVPVIQQDVPVYSEWLGTTDGAINAQIRARVQGYLQARHYREGVFVKTGELLFSIDPRPYQAALDQAKGDLGRAEAALGKTRLDVARYTPLAREGAISQQELDNAVQADRGNQAAVAAAQAAVKQAELNLEWTQIRAPIDGIAGIAIAQIGDLISVNTLLTTVSRVDPIKVTFPISEREYLKFASRIDQAMQAEKRAERHGPPIELILADGSVYPERGGFALPDREVDLKTGTIMVVSYFPNPKSILRPGLYAKVRTVTEQKAGALLIPQRAVQELQGSRRVAIVNAENKVEFRVVKTGTRVGTLWVIEEGLTPGDRVVVEGLQKVRDGVPVVAKPAPMDSRPQEAVAAATPAATVPPAAAGPGGK
jgi:RND family efflux transporter MFP subunit